MLFQVCLLVGKNCTSSWSNSKLGNYNLPAWNSHCNFIWLCVVLNCCTESLHIINWLPSTVGKVHILGEQLPQSLCKVCKEFWSLSEDHHWEESCFNKELHCTLQCISYN